MRIYNYHPATREYLGQAQADESPLEPGVYLIPAFATTIEPPACPLGFIAKFDGEEWALVEYVPPVEVDEPEVAPEEPWLDDCEIRLRLLDRGWLNEVEALVADPETPRAVQIYWERSRKFKRNNVMVLQFAAALGKTDAEMDELFA